MRLRQYHVAGLLLVSALAACSSTQPSADVVRDVPALPSVTPEQPTNQVPAQSATSASTVVEQQPTATATPTGDGPVTPSMALLQLDGERYAAMGDPAAPITIVEFSDYG